MAQHRCGHAVVSGLRTAFPGRGGGGDRGRSARGRGRALAGIVRRASQRHPERFVDLAGVSPTEPFLASYVDAWEPHTFTDPDVPALLGFLKENNIRIGVLSNTMWPRSWHEDVFRRDGVLDLIDGAVYSSEIDWTKPHPEAFRAAMIAVGVSDPERCVFVGDRPYEDVHGARRRHASRAGAEQRCSAVCRSQAGRRYRPASWPAGANRNLVRAYRASAAVPCYRCAPSSGATASPWAPGRADLAPAGPAGDAQAARAPDRPRRCRWSGSRKTSPRRARSF